MTHKTWNRWTCNVGLSTVKLYHHELYAAGQTVSRKRQEDHCKTRRIQHTPTHFKGYLLCLFKLYSGALRPYVAIRWQVQGFVCCMCTCRAGSEAEEHHYGLNTTKTKHRLSGAPQSARRRLSYNRGRGSRLQPERRAAALGSHHDSNSVIENYHSFYCVTHRRLRLCKLASLRPTLFKPHGALTWTFWGKIPKCHFEFWGKC